MGVSFVDVAVEALAALRNYLQQTQSLLRQGSPRRRGDIEMKEDYFGFNVGQVLVGMLKLLKEKGVLEEQEILDMMWEAKEPLFPWTKTDIKELIKL